MADMFKVKVSQYTIVSLYIRWCDALNIQLEWIFASYSQSQ